MNAEPKNCQNCKNNFTIESEDFDFYKKIKVPPPTWCPSCRMLRRLASINHRSLHKRNCSKCNKSVASMYHPDAPFIVYCTECYFSDGWDPMDYGQDYDFSKSFFPQFYALMKKVPQLHIEHTNNNAGNIVFSNYIYRSKNIYLSYGIVRSEDIFYSWGGENGNRMCIDCLNFSENENCYDLVDSNGNYNSRSLTRSHKCIDSAYLFDCSNCNNCFMSSNLRNKSNVFRNQQLSSDAYKQAVEMYKNGSYEEQGKLENEYRELIENAIHKFAVILQSEKCTGDFITNSKNAQQSFSIQSSENVKFGQITTNTTVDSYDFCMSGRADRSYEFAVVGRGNDHLLFSYNTGHTIELEYCDGCNYVQNSFGCIGLKNKEYCIFNKQYTKEEYADFVSRIRNQMKEIPYVDEKGRSYTYGEYFPINFSRFAYNESAAFEMFAIPKEEVLNQGFSWRDTEKRSHAPTVEYNVFPDVLSEIPDTIVDEVLPCLHKGECNDICSVAFKVTKDELLMYRKQGIALPRLCPNCRYFNRQKRTLPWKLWHRSCVCTIASHGHTGKCPNEFETSYAPNRPEKVYCESCYQKEVI